MNEASTPSSHADSEAAIEAALEHHRAGRLSEAEPLYFAILQADPQHVRASRNLGIILLQRRAIAEALPLLAFATSADPEVPQGWAAYIQALVLAKRFETAEALLERVTNLGPLKTKLALHLHQDWCAALYEGGQLEGAEAQFQRAQALAMNDVDATAALGLDQLKLGRLTAAEACLARVLQQAPDHFDAVVNMGSALQAQSRNAEAEAHYRRALELKPGNRTAIRNLCILLNGMQRYEEAQACAEEALARESSIEGLMAQGDALYGLQRFEAARESYAAVAALPGGSYEGLIKVGAALVGLKRYDEALAAMDAAVLERPAEPLARYRRAMTRLLRHDFAGGWSDFEARWGAEGFIAWSSGLVSTQLRRHFDPGLRSEDLVGKRILLVGEQGVGDQVMFASMIPDLASLAAELTCVCDPRLIRLFSASFEGVTFLDPRTAKPALSAYDHVIAMGSLGRLFRNQLSDFPGVAYLRPSPAVRAHWVQRLGATAAGPRIGLSWRGGSPRTGQKQRSVTLGQLSPVLDLPDCTFTSLQYGDPRVEVETENSERGRNIQVFAPEEIADFEDLAGLVEALDVVVSVQTTLVHLAGALGKPCLALVPSHPEWRYAAQGSDMPWYPSVEIFRQSEPWKWDSVIEEVATALQGRLSALRR